MSQHGDLGKRLRKLRQNRGATQKELARTMRVSATAVSSWENGQPVPTERLTEYATIFAYGDRGDPLALQRAEDAATDDGARHDTLLRDLLALQGDQATPGQIRSAMSRRFWRFDDQEPVTILCTPLSDRQIGYDPETDLADAAPIVQYTKNVTHPNYIRNARNGDIDSLIELNGFLKMENPDSADRVRWMTSDRDVPEGRMLGHLVILGGVPMDTSPGQSAVGDLLSRLDLPVRPTWDAQHPLGVEFGGAFVANLDPAGLPDPLGTASATYEADFLMKNRQKGQGKHPAGPAQVDDYHLADGAPQLRSDLALIVRKPNPFNELTTVTLLSGIYSRGTYGAVKAFTDANLRAKNDEWLDESDIVDSRDDFWLLVEVPVHMGKITGTPQLSTHVRLGAAGEPVT